MRTLRELFISGLFVCVCSAPAWATHKSWNIIDPGANCRPVFGGSIAAKFIYTEGAIKNKSTGAAHVSCPVTLAGRYGNHGGPAEFPMARWPAARAATV